MRGTCLTTLFSGTALTLALGLVFPPCQVQAAEKNKSDFSVSRGVARTSSKHGETTQYRNVGVAVIRTQDWPFRWEPDPTKKVTSVEIKLDEQRIYIYQDNLLVGESPISTGRIGYETVTGKFRVLVKEIAHYSNLYGELIDGNGRVVRASAEAGDPIPKGLRYRPSPMPYFIRITDTGTGMHVGFLPGYAASHGCIRLPRKFAPLIYSAISIGTPVIITGATPGVEPKIAKNGTPESGQ